MILFNIVAGIQIIRHQAKRCGQAPFTEVCANVDAFQSRAITQMKMGNRVLSELQKGQSIQGQLFNHGPGSSVNCTIDIGVGTGI